MAYFIAEYFQKSPLGRFTDFSKVKEGKKECKKDGRKKEEMDDRQKVEGKEGGR